VIRHVVYLLVGWFIHEYLLDRMSRKMLELRLGSIGPPIDNDIWRIEWPRDQINK